MLAIIREYIRQGMFIVFTVDIILPPPPCCRCIAKAGIQSIKDLSCDISELKRRTDDIRERNDESSIQAEKAAQRRSVVMPRITSYLAVSAAHTPVYPRPSPTYAELLAEHKHIIATFAPQSSDRTVDCYQRRWVKCRECGIVLRDTEIAYYGGPSGDNLCVCSKCSREKTDKRSKFVGIIRIRK